MAKQRILVLTDEDKQILLEVLDQGRKRRVERPREEPELTIDGSPEVYIVKVPDDGIPGRVGGILGSAYCDVYRTSLDPTDFEGDPLDLEAITQYEEVLFQRRIFNLYHIPIYPWKEEYIKATREKYGLYLAERPDNSFFAIMNEQLNSGGTAEVEFVKNPLSWQRTGITTTIHDYFLNLGDHVDEDAKIEMKKEQDTWVWRVAYCAATDTPPAAADE